MGEEKQGKWPVPDTVAQQLMLEQAAYDSVVDMPCSVCGEINTLEPDALTGYCDFCGEVTVHYGPRFLGFM